MTNQVHGSGKAKSAAAFIVFAVRQAQEAEAFGFSRNECCRNLKTALHQYWQHRTMGLHGQNQKHLVPRSKAAKGKPLNECVVEHAVPLMLIVNILMEMTPLTERRVANLLRKYFCVMLVTEAEHSKLNSNGLRSTMPEDWDRKDVLARYKAVGIKPSSGED